MKFTDRTITMEAATMACAREDATVAIAGAGMIPWRVLTWLRAVERFGVRFRVVGNRLEYEAGEFACIDGLPLPAREFLAEHADELRRVLLATPSVLM